MAEYKILGKVPKNNNGEYKILGRADEQPEEEQIDESSHPFLRMIAGLTNAGRNVHNLPHEQVKSLEEVFGNLGKNFEGMPGPKIPMKEHKPISEYLPNDTHDYADIYGLKGEGNLMEKVLQKGFEYAPEIASIGSLGRIALRSLKGTHQLDEVRRAVSESGLRNFNYHPETIAEARNYLPRSHATNEMIRQVEAGNFNPAMSMQSEIGHHQRNLTRSPLASERLLAPRIGELKQNMLGQIGDVLRSSGMDREADLLRTGIRNYGQFKRFTTAVIPVLKKYGIPTSILAVLGFGYKKTSKALSD